MLGIRFFPGNKIASLKAVLDLKGQAKGSTEWTSILEVAGYASLISEGGGWKIYATQLFTTPQTGPEPRAITTAGWPPRLDMTVNR